MRKRRQVQDRVNHDRWLISYADFITLLFAFFVVMYSLSTLNEGKYRVMSNSVVNAFGKFNTYSNSSAIGQSQSESQSEQISEPNIDPISGPISVKSPEQKSSLEETLGQEREKMKGLAEGIFKALAPLIREGKIDVTQTDRGVSINISDSVLFASGDAKLTPKSSQALIKIASILASDTHDIQVEGFTDNKPIKGVAYPSNWELSAIRAGSVVRLFIDHGVAENRLTAIGQGPKMPVGDNDTAQGRAKNRRVNITILAMLPETKQEVPIEGASEDR